MSGLSSLKALTFSLTLVSLSVLSCLQFLKTTHRSKFHSLFENGARIEQSSTYVVFKQTWLLGCDIDMVKKKRYILECYTFTDNFL